VFVPIGWAGAGIAVICAVVAGVALARGAVGLCGGAAGVWIVGTMLSVAASFANDWSPLIVSIAALTGMLIIGGAIHTLLGRAVRRAA
jgi:hypothetical protein